MFYPFSNLLFIYNKLPFNIIYHLTVINIRKKVFVYILIQLFIITGILSSSGLKSKLQDVSCPVITAS